MSFEENLAKKKKRKGIAYLIASSIFWIPFLISWSQSVLGIEMYSVIGGTPILIFANIFPLIGLLLTIKGIITLAKRNKLTKKENVESRLQKLEQEKSKSDDNPENS